MIMLIIYFQTGTTSTIKSFFIEIFLYHSTSYSTKNENIMMNKHCEKARKPQNCNELFCVEISLALIATIIKTDLKTNVYLKISYDSLLF